MEKKNTGLIVLVVILCLLVGGLTGYIIGNKTFDKNKDVDNNNNNVTDNNKDNSSDNVVNYSFGDEVTISKMSEVKDFPHAGDINDFSKWNVLSDKDNVVTLYSDISWCKGCKVNDYKSSFEKNSVIIESMRGLDENELALLGCDVTTLTCNNVPTWAKTSITSVVSEKSVIIFSEDRLRSISNDSLENPYFRPVITITKSNLEAAK